MKYFTKVLILLAVFSFSLWYFGKNMRVETFSVNTSIEMGESTFPTVSMMTGENQEVNLLYGYSGNVDINNFRDAMMPLDTSNTINIVIHENETTVKKVNYEVIDISTEEVLYSDSISALESTDEGKTAKLKISADLESGTEYSLKITLVTDQSKKIHYFSRIKPIDTPYLDEKLDFVMDYHNATFDSDTFSDYSGYLELDSSQAGESLLDVNLYSKVKDITWDGMDPEIVSEIVPTIKEINSETIAVQLKYLVKGTITAESETDTESEEGTETTVAEETTYEVTEFYRIRYTSDRTYLLKWTRTMDAIYDFSSFDPESVLDSSSPYINLGLTDASDTQVISTEDGSKLAFVDHGTLWHYDINTNKIVSVLTYQDQSDKYYSSAYDSYNIKMLDINESGDVDFLVYGYVSKGDYEGKIGMILYKYYASEDRIEEQMFIPIERPYEVIESEMDGLYYLSDLDVFYFSMNNSLYAYNINSRKLTTISEDVTSSSLALSTKGQFVTWQEASDVSENTQLNILNLETEQTYTITADEGTNIVLDGVSDTYLIYGIVKSSNIATLSDDSTVYPMSKVIIADATGNELKTYKPSSGYVTNVKITNNSIDLTLMKKSDSDGYVKSGTDYIVNKITEETSAIAISKKEVATGYKEVRISLPSDFATLLLHEDEDDTDSTESTEDESSSEEEKIDYTPVVTTTKSTIITEDTTVQVQTEDSSEVKYYAYAGGELQGVYAKAAAAIAYADEQMGVVVDSNNHIIWERGETDSSAVISNISKVDTSSSVTSGAACVAMVLNYNHSSADAKELTEQNVSIYNLLKANLEYTPVNLTGSTLSEVLYYISNQRPVIAMRSGSNAVIITGYSDSSVTYYDPSIGQSVTKSLSAAEGLFEDAGNVFISYSN